MKMENEATKFGDSPTKWSTGIKVNDIGFRLILIPCFGIVIPIATRMVSQLPLSLWQIKFAYLYNIGIAFIIWEGNRYLLFTLRSYFNWFKTPVQKIVVLIVSVSFYTIP